MRWEYFNPSPGGRRVGDCTVRAVARALGMDWEQAYVLLADKGLELMDMPSSNAVWGAVLKDHGFRSRMVPDACPQCYTVADFAQDHPRGTYVLCTGSHAVCLEDGTVYDTWDSTAEIVVFYWYKEGYR